VDSLELWDRIKALPGFPVLMALGICVGFLLYIFGYKLWNEWLGWPRWAEEWPNEKHFWRRYFAWFWLPDVDPDPRKDEDEWPPAECPKCGGSVFHITGAGALYCQRCRTVVGTRSDEPERLRKGGGGLG
jgi:hypothetical protein